MSFLKLFWRLLVTDCQQPSYSEVKLKPLDWRTLRTRTYHPYMWTTNGNFWVHCRTDLDAEPFYLGSDGRLDGFLFGPSVFFWLKWGTEIDSGRVDEVRPWRPGLMLVGLEILRWRLKFDCKTLDNKNGDCLKWFRFNLTMNDK